VARNKTVVAMANFHCTAQMISRQGGKSCVAALAYRSDTELVDQRTGDIWSYPKKANVEHVEFLIPHNAPAWISDIAQECRSDRQSALQKFSEIIEASEKRKDSQVYREVEFSLPNELTKEQNIEWANAFVRDVFVERGMVAVLNFHFDIDPKTGMEKPHCHVLLSTRHLTGDGFGLKNREWNNKELIDEAREQCAQYQNAALKEHGHNVQVTH
jgi:ATP-dependent exoDNAse (exonuclease V) alpha subunit